MNTSSKNVIKYYEKENSRLTKNKKIPNFTIAIPYYSWREQRDVSEIEHTRIAFRVKSRSNSFCDQQYTSIEGKIFSPPRRTRGWFCMERNPISKRGKKRKKEKKKKRAESYSANSGLVTRLWVGLSGHVFR